MAKVLERSLYKEDYYAWTAHSDEAGRGFRSEAGHDSYLKAASSDGVSAGRGG